jgi:hypothetical protein
MSASTGVIIPPPDIKNLVDKTAKTVAQRGPELEELVKKNFIDNPKFSFLKYNDPYRPYFDQKVQEFKSGGGDADMEQDGEPNHHPDKRAIRPPPEVKFVYDCGSVSVVENDIIQHTAQFVATNGHKFLIALTEREKNNPQFEFLKPTHSMFPYFTSLIDSYSRIMDFNDKDLEQLLSFIADKKAILRSCGEIFEYEAETQHNKRKKEELEEEERAQRAMIDWNDFVVVQTIDFEEQDKDLPAPIDLSVREKLHHLEFTKANINPEFAFMLDATQVFAANLAKQGYQVPNLGNGGQQPKAIKDAAVDKVYMANAPVINRTAYDKKAKEEVNNDISINLRVSSSTIFGEFAGKALSIEVNPELTISEILSQFTKRIQGFPPGCRLRSVDFDVLEGIKSLADYKVYNGAVLELLPPN